VNVVLNMRFHKMRGISLLGEDLLASQQGQCSMDLVSYLWSCSVVPVSVLYMNHGEQMRTMQMAEMHFVIAVTGRRMTDRKLH
jgi:hypothetical protein